MPRIFELPYEILCEIMSYLTEHDIGYLAETCHYFGQLARNQDVWKGMFKSRFIQFKTVDSSQNNFSWKDLYIEKALLRLSAAQDMSIVHKNPPYWDIVPTRESCYGYTAKLGSVCWLDVNGIIKRVPPGVYKIQWRMRITSSAQWNEPLDFTASLERNGNRLESPAVKYTTPDQFFRQKEMKKGSWMIATLPEQLNIPEQFGYTDVRLSHEKKTGQWKSGLELDWVRLVPISLTIKYSRHNMLINLDYETPSQNNKDRSPKSVTTRATRLALTLSEYVVNRVFGIQISLLSSLKNYNE
ncbi:hypothetical protein CLU79DRAFT_15809 [Phycomyces nitens]|nr:hypothetical protein CLU79DRAFT_15809 [Phycomyces nitens]